MRQPLALSICFALATPLGAHPHIFVDTGIEVIVNEAGRATHLRITWAYDEFYSLLVTEERGLDPDYDGVLTEDEIASLNGFDMQWIEGFNGDTVALSDGEELPLSKPEEVSTRFLEGRIVTRHLRAIEGALPEADGLVIKPYDATYYTDYQVVSTRVTGSEDCRTRVKMPDITEDLRALQADLGTLDAQTDPSDVGLPDIGAALASEVRVTCERS